MQSYHSPARGKRYAKLVAKTTIAVWICLMLMAMQFGGSSIARADTGNSFYYIDEFPVPTHDSGPLAITNDKNGNVWFTESRSGKIGRFDPSSRQYEEFPLPNGTGDMWGILVSGNGEVWFTQSGASAGSNYTSGSFAPGGPGNLWSFDPTTHAFRSHLIADRGRLPFRLAADPMGRIWFTELLGNRLGLFDPSLQEFHEFEVPTANAGPADLTIDSRGFIWLTESWARAIAVFNPANESFREYRLPELASPVGISLDLEGRIWVADHGSNRIASFNPQTAQVNAYPTSNPTNDIFPLSIPNDIIVAPSGQVWFTEHIGNRIGRFDPVQQSLAEYIIPSGPVSTALWLTMSPDGRVWFTEYSNNAIGFVDPSVPLLFSVSADHLSEQIEQGSVGSIVLGVNGNEYRAQDLQLLAASTSQDPEDLGVSFSRNPIQIDPQSVYRPVTTADIQVNENTLAGKYTVAIGATDGRLLVSSAMISVKVTESDSILRNISVYLPLEFLGAVGVILFVIQKQRRTKLSLSWASLRCFLAGHNMALLKVGLAATILTGVVGGYYHIILFTAQLQAIPLSNATLATYGNYSAWLDIAELFFLLWTVAGLLVVRKPSKRVSAGILLGVLLLSTFLAGAGAATSKPHMCDVIIKNSVFAGGYNPSLLKVVSGSNVAWCNDNYSLHADTVTSDNGLFNSGLISQGSSWTYIFAKPGEYHYHSLLHFWMRGTILVTTSDASNSSIGTSDLTSGQRLPIQMSQQWRPREAVSFTFQEFLE